ncbi:hypothetical protein C8R46DRAFT_896615 [Mycena filopes]|nr:hypothetical protein C8R46DRAFT_896615 [Mycena filopes]
MSSLSSVVSNLVRASMGTSVSSQVTNEELDKHVAELILKEAKKKAERFGQDGIRAYLRSGVSDSNAPKTNKRFLSSIIRSTDDHNKTILQAQALAAQELKRERDELERRERRARAEEAVEAEKLRRARGEGSSRRRRTKVEDSWDHWDGRTAERPKRKQRAWETWNGLDEDEEEDDDARDRHRSGSGRHRSRERRRRRDRDGDGHTSSRHSRRERSADGPEEDSSRRHRHDEVRSRGRPADSGSKHCRHALDSLSPTPSDDSRPRKRRRSVSRSRSRSDSRRSGNASPAKDKAEEVAPTRARDDDDRPPEPSIPPPPPPSSPPRRSKRERSRSREPTHKRARANAEASSSRSTRPSSRTTRPPSRSPSLTPGPEPEIQLPSKMDKYFEESYDPRLDVAPLTAPHVPATGLINNAEFEGWDAMLELIRIRKEDREEKKMLERLGLTKEKVKSSHSLGPISSSAVNDRWSGQGLNIMEIEYNKRGAVREWDMGKEGF